MRLGIKCEIHDCTIALVKFLEEEGVLDKGISKMLDKDKELRIDNQYYLKNKAVDVDFDKLSGFLILVKDALGRLDDDKIKDLREKIGKF